MIYFFSQNTAQKANSSYKHPYPYEYTETNHIPSVLGKLNKVTAYTPRRPISESIYCFG